MMWIFIYLEILKNEFIRLKKRMELFLEKKIYYAKISNWDKYILNRS